MRKTLSNANEVFHFWANQVQPSGTAGNVFFDGSKVYSYGRHFCIARILPDGKKAFTTRSYSPTTSGHVSGARQAVNGSEIVYCNDPSEAAPFNMDYAKRDINRTLADCEKKGIRKATIEKLKANALSIAINANKYLAALPKVERTAKPINTATLDNFRAAMLREENKAKKAREKAEKARAIEQLQYLADWRNDPTMYSHSMHYLDTALRINGDNVETSKGANIPVSDALRLWPIILRCKDGSKDYTPGMPLGNYRLTQIKSTGDIVVGCHNIAFSEIQIIANKLGLV